MEVVALAHKFLVVDDSAVIRLGLERALEQLKVPADHVESVESAEEALKRFEDFGPSVVFMDLNMPGMSGEEAALKMLEADPEVKLVVVTAVERGAPEVRHLVSMGAFAVLEKPVRAEDVRALLSEIDREESGAGRIK